MTSILLADNAYITLTYLPEQKMLHHTIHKPVDEAIFKDALNAGVQALAQYDISCWLSDDRKNGPLSPEFSQWALNDWIPRAVTTGWKYWANVVPEDIAAAHTLTPFIEALHDLGLRMMVFTNTQDATNWLQQMA